MVGGATAQHAPEALHHIALRALARSPIQAQRRMGRSHCLHPRATMPGGLVTRDDDRGRRGRWLQAGDSLERGGKGALPPLLFAGASRACAAGGRLQQAGRQLPGPQGERGHTIDLLFVLPRPYHGPVTLHAQGGVERRHQRPTRFILAPQDTRPRRRFFLTWPVRREQPVAAPGRRAESATWAERVGCPGADRTRAWPCASPRSLWSDTGMLPALHRSSARAQAHSAAGRLAPPPGAWAPTARECAPSALAPSGAVTPSRPVPATASAIAARSCDAPLHLGRGPCASAPDSPSRPLGTGRGGVDRAWS